MLWLSVCALTVWSPVGRLWWYVAMTLSTICTVWIQLATRFSLGVGPPIILICPTDAAGSPSFASIVCQIASSHSFVSANSSSSWSLATSMCGFVLPVLLDVLQMMITDHDPSLDRTGITEKALRRPSITVARAR